MPASNIDFTTLTHVIHFSVVPNADGTLDSDGNSISSANSSDIISKAHAAGRKVSICVGGGGTENLFQGATSSDEPSHVHHQPHEFHGNSRLRWSRYRLGTASRHRRPTIYQPRDRIARCARWFFRTQIIDRGRRGLPALWRFAHRAISLMFAALQNQFDQLNVMTYDMSGPYDGWITWFNSPLFDGGSRFPSTGALLPSLGGAVANYTNKRSRSRQAKYRHSVLRISLDRRARQSKCKASRNPGRLGPHPSPLPHCHSLQHHFDELLSNESLSLGYQRTSCVPKHH